MSTQYRAYVSVSPRLERMLEEELRSLGIDSFGPRAHGGVEIKGTRETVWTAVHRSRLAEAVSIEVGSFDAPNGGALAQGISRIPWHAYGGPNSVVEVRAFSQRSALSHTGIISEACHLSITERLAGAPRDGAPLLRVMVRLVRDKARVLLDVVGDPLHRRGWRSHVGVAPLRETLAAACVNLANFEPGPIWDPFCGSGTMLIEAALRGAAFASGTDRAMQFQSWPSHDAEAYKAWADGVTGAPQAHEVIGSDLVAKEVDAAKANAARAGVTASWHVGDFANVAHNLPEGTCIFTNLPYGLRSGGPRQNVIDLFERFGQTISDSKRFSKVVVLNGNSQFARTTGLRWKPLLEFRNRGLRVSALELQRSKR